MWKMQKEVQNLTNQNTETEKLNTSTLDKIVNEHHRHNGFS